MGSIIISAFNMVGAVASFPIVARFGRKPILMWGYIFITIFHMTIGILTILDYNYAVLVFICLFIITYQISTGQIAWIYAAETCTDISLGAVIYMLWFTVLVLMLTSEPLMDSAI
jgi:hypothetical protein